MVYINTEYITLTQLLKMTNYVSSGGESKIALKSVNVMLNGEKENRRNKKIYVGDVVIIENKKFVIEHENSKD